MTLKNFKNEREQRQELLFALHYRDSPTIIFIEYSSKAINKAISNEMDSFLKNNLKEYQFYDVDLTDFSVTSLLKILIEKLPENITNSKPVQYVVNVYGLEKSLLNNGDNNSLSQLASQLNLERELLFRKVPYIIIIWANKLFFQSLQRESPDLWSWVVYKFYFEELAINSDQILLDKLKDNDQNAWRQVYSENFNKVVNYLTRRNVSRSDAEEIFHETLLVLDKRKTTLTLTSKLSVFLIGVAIRINYNIWRKERDMQLHTSVLDDLDEDDIKFIEEVDANGFWEKDIEYQDIDEHFDYSTFEDKRKIIEELTKTYYKITNEKKSIDKTRYVIDRINILSLLANEYIEIREYYTAERIFEYAIGIANKNKKLTNSATLDYLTTSLKNLIRLQEKSIISKKPS